MFRTPTLSHLTFNGFSISWKNNNTTATTIILRIYMLVVWHKLYQIHIYYIIYIQTLRLINRCNYTFNQHFIDVLKIVLANITNYEDNRILFCFKTLIALFSHVFCILNRFKQCYIFAMATITRSLVNVCCWGFSYIFVFCFNVYFKDNT